MVKLLLNFGVDIGAQNGSDETAFDIAHVNGQRDVVNFLAKHDGNLSSRLGEPGCSTSLEVVLEKQFFLNQGRHGGTATVGYRCRGKD